MPSQQMASLKSDISLSSLKLRRPKGTPSVLSGGISLKRRRTVAVGLDIQPGYIAAAKARLNGGLVVEQAAAVSLPADTVREGEVLNQEGLATALRELFGASGLDKHVRIGVANQRTVMRTLEVPPLSDQKELAAAVRFQAEDQVPMPLNNAVLDFRPLGVVDTPEGARQRVLLVAAQRDMIEKLLAAVKAAGLHADGIDLSAFALIRSLYRADRQQGEEAAGRVLYLNVGGLTNMAIAEGTTCRFTRVLGRGLEAIAAEVAERRAVPIDQARELLRRVNLSALGGDSGRSALGMMGAPAAPSPEAPASEQPAPAAAGGAPGAGEGASPVIAVVPEHPADGAGAEGEQPVVGPPAVDGGAAGDAGERPTLTVVGGEGEAPPLHAVPESDPGAGGADVLAGGEADATASFGGTQEQAAGAQQPSVPDASAARVPTDSGQAAPTPAVEDLSDVRLILEAGVRAIADEVRNSLDFYQGQEHGGPVATVFLSGPALDIPGFGEILEQNLRVPVRGETVTAAGPGALAAGISPQYLAIAAGLAIEEVGS
jgi:type IV pilus assembly protein PilM